MAEASTSESFRLGQVAVEITGLRLESLLAKMTGPVQDRADFANGFLQSSLDVGNWQEVLELTANSERSRAVLPLLDSGAQAYVQKIISWVKQQKPGTVEVNDTSKRLLASWTPQARYDFAILTAVKTDEGEKIVRDLAGHITTEQTRAAYLLFGDREFTAGNFSLATQYYLLAENKEKVNSLFAHVLENAAADNLHLLINIAEKERGKSCQILTTVINDKELREKAAEERVGGTLYKLQEYFKFRLSRREKANLLEIAAKSIDKWNTDKYDPALQLVWARENTTKEPDKAYVILAERKGTSSDRLVAALSWIEQAISSNHTLPLQITKTDLKTILSGGKASLAAKVAIAESLEDKPTLLRLSKAHYNKWLAAEDSAHRQTLLRTAYDLWFDGGGSDTARYIMRIRSTLIAQDMKEDRLPSFYWLRASDVQGHINIYAAVINSNPAIAYRLATDIKDEQLLQGARAAILKASPAGALGIFSRNHVDSTGSEMAIIALAKKYGISAEAVRRNILPQLIK